MRFNGILMGFNGILMRFNGILMRFNGISGGFNWISGGFNWISGGFNGILMGFNRISGGFNHQATINIYINAVCWFGIFFMTFHMLGIIIPTDEHIFQRGRYTTNQLPFGKLT